MPTRNCTKEVDKMYFFIQSRSGSIYIVNVRSYFTIVQSLQFYEATSLRNKVVKILMIMYIFAMKFMGKKRLNNSELIRQLNATYYFDCRDSIDDNICCGYINSYKTKLIVNNSDGSFFKISIKEAMISARKEINIYNFLHKDYVSFSVPQIESVRDRKGSVSFRMKNPQRLDSDHSFTIVDTLVELFHVSRENRLIKYTALIAEFELISIKPTTKKLLLSLVQRTPNFKIPLGFVHGDFKLWNLRGTSRPLIFDFENSTSKGIVLFDLISFLIEPDIRHKNWRRVYKKLHQTKSIALFEEYLKKLSIDVDHRYLVILYFLCKVSRNPLNDSMEIREKYENILSSYLSELVYE